MLWQHTTLNCRGRIVDVAEPLVMGIINVTPDSFYVGSRAAHADGCVVLAGKMLAAGATFIDIGGASSRPEAAEISLLRPSSPPGPPHSAVLAPHTTQHHRRQNT